MISNFPIFRTGTFCRVHRFPHTLYVGVPWCRLELRLQLVASLGQNGTSIRYKLSDECWKEKIAEICVKEYSGPFIAFTTTNKSCSPPVCVWELSKPCHSEIVPSRSHKMGDIKRTCIKSAETLSPHTFAIIALEPTRSNLTSVLPGIDCCTS